MQHTMATPSASESPSSISSDGILQLWDVQEILAEHTSGGVDLLGTNKNVTETWRLQRA